MKIKKQGSIKISVEQLDSWGYHTFLKAKVDGKKCRFLIDTGASHSVIDKKFYEKIIGVKKMETHRTATTTLHNSTSETQYGDIRRWAIGSLIMKDYKMVIADLTHLNNYYNSLNVDEIIGIVGCDVLVKHKISIEYSKSRMVWY